MKVETKRERKGGRDIYRYRASCFVAEAVLSECYSRCSSCGEMTPVELRLTGHGSVEGHVLRNQPQCQECRSKRADDASELY